MSIENVRKYFKEMNIEKEILEFEVSTSTVDLAAAALGIIPARIAKTLSFKLGDTAILVVTSGDMKIDNKKFKDEFKTKAKMLKPEEVIDFTGHAIGGVCPFGLTNDLKVYLDVSMQNYETLYPACGSSNSAVEMTCDELFKYSKAEKWVDVCK